MRAAYQNVYIGNNSKPAYSMQATIWKDKKQVGLLHNFDVKTLERGSHYVERWSPRRKRKRDIDSPTAVSSYTNNYNEVDITSLERVLVFTRRMYQKFYVRKTRNPP